VLLLGLDTPSVDALDSEELPVHRALVARRIAILEGLALEGVPEGEYELIALPLPLRDLDGSPVRAVLREV
jgi:arylformamidase